MTAALAEDDIFHVLVSDDDMKRMSVEQLADAFRLSVIDASTLVWQTGMNGWRRLGSIADVEEDEPETAVLWAAPPPPPPVRAPQRRAPVSYSPTVSYPAPVAYQAAEPYYAPEPEPYVAQGSYPMMAATVARPEPLAPGYATAFPAPDPYVLPRRHVALPDKIDFRRAPGSIRWGRWFVATLLLTTGVLGAYRQNLLRDGARGIGIESTYLAAERRATAFVSSNASPSVKSALTRLSLLPGPNAERDAAFASRTAVAPVTPAATLTPAPAALPPCVAQPAQPAQPAEPQQEPRTRAAADPALKTVSLNSLPVLGGKSRARQSEPSETAASARVDGHARSSKKKARREPIELTAEAKAQARAERRAKARAEADADAAAAAREESEPRAKRKKVEPQREAALPPPPSDGNPLKAAMWKTVASDAKKLEARKRRD